MNFVITCKATITTSSPTCEVCLNVLEKVLQDVSYQDRVQVERSIDTFCQTADGKDAKLCYSLSVIKKDVSQVISLGLPLDKVCERLSKKDETVCALKYPKPPTDLKTLSLETLRGMRVKALRDILEEHGVNCLGCVEKQDFVDRITSLRDEL